METILALLVNSQGSVRRSYLYGKEFLVAPVTMIVPGVMNGSDGPLYYSPEEVGKDPSLWNHIPLVAPSHPTANGKPVSARSPEILEKYGVGMVLRSNFSDKLTAEAWFDVEASNRVDRRIVPMVRNGKPLEVSTGLFLQRTPAGENAVFNGVSYKYTTSHYKPDHLAVLMDEKGACGVKDGCGVLVNSENRPVDNQKLSHSDIRMKLSEQLREKFGYKEYEDGYQVPHCYLIDVFDRDFVYSKGEELYRLGYKTDNRTGDVEITGEPVEVSRVVSYKPVTNREVTMNRDETITWLTLNCECWKGDEGKESLSKLTDNQLKTLKAKAEEGQKLVANSIAGSFSDSLGNVHTWDADKKQWQTKPPEKKEEKPVETPVQNALTKEQLEDLEFARRVKTDLKNRHITAITANAQCKFSKEQLEKMDLNTLENLALLATPPAPAPSVNTEYLFPSYGGAAVPPVHNSYKPAQEDLDAVVVPPEPDFKELVANRK
jgi:hypothetical protein